MATVTLVPSNSDLAADDDVWWTTFSIGAANTRVEALDTLGSGGTTVTETAVLSGTTQRGMHVTGDGLRMYVAEDNGLTRLSFGTAGDVTTLTVEEDGVSVTGSPRSVWVSDDGTDALWMPSTTSVAHATMSTPHDLSTLGTATTQSTIGWSSGTNLRGIAASQDGLKIMLVTDDGDLHRFDLASAYNVSEMASSPDESVASGQSSPRDIAVLGDGAAVIIHGSSLAETINVVWLKEAWSLTSLGQTFTKATSSLDGYTAVDGVGVWKIDEDSYRIFSLDGPDVYMFPASESFPIEWDAVTDVEIVVHYRVDSNWSDDDFGLEAYVRTWETVGSDPLGALNASGDREVIDAVVDNTTEAVQTVSFTYAADVNAGAWRGADLILHQTFNRNMGGDGARIEIDYVAVTVTYTPSPVSVTVSGSSHGHTSDAATTTPSGGTPTVAPADSQHHHTSGPATVDVAYAVTVTDTQHGHTSDVATVDVSYAVAAADSQHHHTSDAPTTAVAYDVAVTDTQHGHTSDVAAVDVFYTAAAADNQHGHTSGPATVDVAYTVTVTDTQHGHVSDVAAVDVFYTVAPANSQHGHTSDIATTSVAYDVAVTDTQHGHGSDVATVDVAYTVAPADSQHGHTSGIATTGGSVSVTVADSQHGHTDDIATVDVTYAVTVPGSQHDHTSGPATVDVAYTVTAVGSTHGHTSDGVTVDVTFVTGVADSQHGHTSGPVTVAPPAYIVTAADSQHGHTSDAVNVIDATLVIDPAATVIVAAVVDAVAVTTPIDAVAVDTPTDRATVTAPVDGIMVGTPVDTLTVIRED